MTDHPNQITNPHRLAEGGYVCRCAVALYNRLTDEIVADVADDPRVQSSLRRARWHTFLALTAPNEESHRAQLPNAHRARIACRLIARSVRAKRRAAA